MSLVACLAAACTGSPVVITSSQPPPTTTTPPPPPSFTLAAGGDILVHPLLTEQADLDGGRTFGPILDGLRQAVDADLSICHLETPLSAPGDPTYGYPAFSAPPEVATALKDLGYDSCSTASNHTLDRGSGAIKTTLDVLDAAGLKHTGSFRTPEESATPLLLDARGVKVAQLSFTYGFNGIPLPKPWMANQLSVDGVLTAARAAKAAGAEVVVASLHWGAEYQHEATPEQREMARAILADPAVDLIIGTHVHAVQPVEQVDGKWVVYGMGNEVARHSEPRGITEEGIVTRFTFVKGPDGWAVEHAEYVPTLVEFGPPIRVVDLTRAPTTPRRAEALARTDDVVKSLGSTITRR
ncbi:CapA family protein [Actinosynnema sp. NPDC047251]|uniref:Poly-gamma-glutamate synthesis protein involved in capsule biosynthesis n=1 Tax=Saccharothrix espanaensis (strain ATCC 51144 / DSM 44229 / JCM 9112 / NBRC 15066 / NRRL 15764) TaxID=1179773 RepID=K0JR86_SACES|nr:CapA family protein [Saccharothrix espanaensis]CCH27822.1 poly-gamma-glutamate synthesis protein involved in capsule biosynthesis [Saccharothrix espanaensis DSM 44229]